MNIKMVDVRRNPHLREFILEDVRQSENSLVLGTGSYGTVQEVTINDTKYAAKRIHEVLLETDERGGVERIVDRYIEECRLMSSIRHPNVTLFMGVCFLDGCRLPLLVMEMLDSSLDDLLETCPSIPLLLKVSILSDVARGLNFLHKHTPSIIHRDLTAKNVLLTVFLTAKITDFGNSRLVQLQPDELARTLTRAPGTLVYMPPEALSTLRSSYGPQLDIFSFGVIALFTLNQVFPGDLLSPTHQDPSNPDLLLARSEIERRVTYTDLLETSLLLGRQHPLFVLVRECLSNTPERRPLTSRLLSTLEEMRIEMDVGLLQLDVARVKTVKSSIAKDKRIEVLQREVAAKNVAITQRDTLLQEKDAQLEVHRNEIVTNNNIITQENSQLEAQVHAHRNEIVTKNNIITQKNSQLEAQVHAHRNEIIAKDNIITQNNSQLADNNSQLAEKDTQLAVKEAQIEEHREEIGHKDAELARRAALIQQLEELVHPRPRGTEAIQIDLGGDSLARLNQPPPPELKTPLTLKWRRGKDMPFKLSDAIQSVVIGNKVFVGGGSSLFSDVYTVMVYDLQDDQWNTLPQYSARWFAMAALNNELVLIGGHVSCTHKPTNQVSVLESKKWVCPYPALNIPRYRSTAVSFNNHIIVAGGTGSGGHRISSVEVLDITSNRWCIADPLPCVLSSMRSVVMGNMCYLMGGADLTGKYTHLVHSVDLEELTTNVVSMATSKTRSRHSSLWRTEEVTPLNHCTPFALKGSLLAVGGRGDRYEANASIYLYQPDTRRWMKVGDLSTARYDCTCSVLPNGEVLVAGGCNDWLYLETVDFLSVTECF